MARMPTREELPGWVTTGASFVDETSPTHSDKWHVRGIVDGLAVCRTYSREKQRWRYEVLSPAFFSVMKVRPTPPSNPKAQPP